ncbi:MAG: hypothetical protein WB992_12610 [Bryobacteraceae bacterium]
MTLDQKIQVWVAIGTWLSSIGTIAAVIVALYLARRGEEVRLNVEVGLMQVVMGDGTPFQEHVGINVTNLGERPVTVNTVGWAIGKGKKRGFAIQPLNSPHSAQYPIELAHGKSASFLVSFDVMPDWKRQFATGFVKDLSDKSLKTLVAQVHTSLGKTFDAHPRKDLLDALREFRR